MKEAHKMAKKIKGKRISSNKTRIKTNFYKKISYIKIMVKE